MTPTIFHDPYEGHGDGTFGTLIERLDDVWKELKKELSHGSWADRQLLTEMENWIRNRFDGTHYNNFAAFARQFCQFDERPAVKRLRKTLFPKEFPHGLLVYFEWCDCWTLGLNESEQRVATHGYLDARLLAAEAFVWITEGQGDAVPLCQRYFDFAEREPIKLTRSQLATKFQILDSALDSNLAFVLCKGNPQRSGNRTQAYVDPGLDNYVSPQCAQVSRCIYLNAGFFRGNEPHDLYTVSGEQLLYHGMTILHELTHHILKTEDLNDTCYGRAKCFKLAESFNSPNISLRNADNYALFARDLKLSKTGSKLNFLATTSQSKS